MSRFHGSSLARSIVGFLLFISLVSAQSAKQTCYLPGGSKATNPQWLPCSTDLSNPLSNICCALNRNITSGGVGKDEFTVADICLDNGICMNKWQDENGKAHTNYMRAYCTDKEFASGKCLNICGKDGTGWKKATPCDGTQNSSLWCCGDNDDCCNQSLQEKQGLKPVSIAALFQTTSATVAAASPTNSPTNTTPGGQESSPTSGATTSATDNASSSTGSPTPENSSSGLSTGAKAGIGVGAVGAVLALIGIGAFIMRRRRAKAASKLPELPYDNEVVKYGYVQQPGQYLEANSIRDPGELGAAATSKRPMMEMSALEVPAVELPDSEVRLGHKNVH